MAVISLVQVDQPAFFDILTVSVQISFHPTMRLIQIEQNGGIQLVEYRGRSKPPYAILSHTWGKDWEEVTYSDVVSQNLYMKPGYRKIELCREQAARYGLKHFWIDTCCIDKSNSVELQEAINSMFRWYKNSRVCFVYLADVYTHQDLAQSRWFTRGWTLQELIAPKVVQFYSREMRSLGTKESLLHTISAVTKIPPSALMSTDSSQFSVEERMEWASGRHTTIEEDEVYCLLGIFGIYMPLIYGEGREHAFKRLRREIDPATCYNPCDRSSSPEPAYGQPIQPRSTHSQSASQRSTYGSGGEQSTYHSSVAPQHIGAQLYAGAQYYAGAQHYAGAEQYARTNAHSKAYAWICSQCNYGPLSIDVLACPDCQHVRSPRCTVQVVKVC